MAFTPAPALLGGLSLGALSVAKLVLTGRVLGISGSFKGIVEGSREPWRYCFVGGLVAGGLALAMLWPMAFEAALPAAYGMERAATGGLMVGIGTSLGGGCTSGHGICGNARLSLRSVVATLTFMTVGALAAWQSRVTAVFSLAPGVAPLAGQAPAPLMALGAATLAASLALTPVASGVAFWLSRDKGLTPSPAVQLLGDAVELTIGFLFALGLGVSGMLRPSKVAAFLSVFSGSFDPSLAFVMGGALLLAVPAFQYVLRSKSPADCPVCALEYALPTATAIDARLVLGSAVFGAGWGVSGMCPGPALVNLAAPQPQVLVFVAAMAGGMALVRLGGALMVGMADEACKAA